MVKQSNPRCFHSERAFSRRARKPQDPGSGPAGWRCRSLRTVRYGCIGKPAMRERGGLESVQNARPLPSSMVISNAMSTESHFPWQSMTNVLAASGRHGRGSPPSLPSLGCMGAWVRGGRAAGHLAASTTVLCCTARDPHLLQRGQREQVVAELVEQVVYRAHVEQLSWHVLGMITRVEYTLQQLRLQVRIRHWERTQLTGQTNRDARSRLPMRALRPILSLEPCLRRAVCCRLGVFGLCVPRVHERMNITDCSCYIILL